MMSCSSCTVAAPRSGKEFGTKKIVDESRI
jgi:hypothetical protein